MSKLTSDEIFFLVRVTRDYLIDNDRMVNESGIAGMKLDKKVLYPALEKLEAMLPPDRLQSLNKLDKNLADIDRLKKMDPDFKVGIKDILPDISNSDKGEA